MKTISIIACFLAASCNSIVTETLDPVTGKPTSRTTTTTVDSGAITAGANTVAVIVTAKSYEPKGRVHAEK